MTKTQSKISVKIKLQTTIIYNTFKKNGFYELFFFVFTMSCVSVGRTSETPCMSKRFSEFYYVRTSIVSSYVKFSLGNQCTARRSITFYSRVGEGGAIYDGLLPNPVQYRRMH